MVVDCDVGHEFISFHWMGVGTFHFVGVGILSVNCLWPSAMLWTQERGEKSGR